MYSPNLQKLKQENNDFQTSKENRNDETTEDYSYQKLPESNQTFEGYIMDSELINNEHIFLQQVRYIKSSQCYFMIRRLIIESQNFNYLRIQDQEKAIINIEIFTNTDEEDLKTLLDQINHISLVEKDIILQPIYCGIIKDKNDENTCYVLEIRSLDTEVIDHFPFLEEESIKKVMVFVQQILVFLQQNESLQEFISEDVIDYIYIELQGNLRLDYFYFFDKKFHRKKSSSKQNCQFSQDQINQLKFKCQQNFNLLNNILQQHQKMLNQESTEEQNNNQQAWLSETHNQQLPESLVISPDKNYQIQRQAKQENQQYQDLSDFLKATQLNIISRFSSFLSEYSIENLSQTAYTTAESLTSDISNRQSINKNFDINSQMKDSDKINSDIRTDIVESFQDKAVSINLDEQQQNQLEQQIYQKCKQNIREGVENFLQILKMKFFTSKQIYSSRETNQNIYLSFVCIAKKIFYKHILKQSIISYEESPFYYRHFMLIKSKIQDYEEEYKTKILTTTFKQNIDAINYIYQLQDLNLLGDIQSIQLSLQECLTKQIMQTPIRFNNCIRHIECFDLSSLEYLQGAKECPECFQNIRDYYNDKYLQLILNFLNKKRNITTQDNLINLLQGNQFFPYVIESVKVSISNGIFIPQIEFIQIDTNEFSNNYIEIPNVIDQEYLYQIIKYNTFEMVAQSLQQFTFLGLNSNQPQPIKSILDFRRFTDGNYFSLSKVYNKTKFIEFPIRNSQEQCQHIDCFDLSDLFLINRPINFQENNLSCPICQNNFKLEDLIYDKEYAKIIEFAESNLIQEPQLLDLSTVHQNTLYLAQIDFRENTIIYLNKSKQIHQISQNQYDQYTQKDYQQINQLSESRFRSFLQIKNGKETEDEEYEKKLFQQVIDGANQDQGFAYNYQISHNNQISHSLEYQLDNFCLYQRLKEEEEQTTNTTDSYKLNNFFESINNDSSTYSFDKMINGSNTIQENYRNPIILELNKELSSERPSQDSSNSTF